MLSLASIAQVFEIKDLPSFGEIWSLILMYIIFISIKLWLLIPCGDVLETLESAPIRTERFHHEDKGGRSEQLCTDLQ